MHLEELEAKAFAAMHSDSATCGTFGNWFDLVWILDQRPTGRKAYEVMKPFLLEPGELVAPVA